MSVTCKFCNEPVTDDGQGAWVDATGGDVCSGDDYLINENESHVPNIPLYIWRDPNSDGWVDAWNGAYETLEEALEDAPAGVGTSWVIERGEGLVSEDEAERRRTWSAYDEPEMQKLCTDQIRALSDLTARHAQDRIRLALRLRKERLGDG